MANASMTCRVQPTLRRERRFLGLLSSRGAPLPWLPPGHGNFSFVGSAHRFLRVTRRHCHKPSLQRMRSQTKPCSCGSGGRPMLISPSRERHL